MFTERRATLKSNIQISTILSRLLNQEGPIQATKIFEYKNHSSNLHFNAFQLKY